VKPTSIIGSGDRLHPRGKGYSLLNPATVEYGEHPVTAERGSRRGAKIGGKAKN
jgi:hypothetical protein